jgi:DNA-binding transcriptional regulator YdaS (Cro superfamily)
MNIDSYLKDNGQSINAFANQHNIPATTVWRAVKNMVLRPRNALRIEQATGGAVTLRELLFPKEHGGDGLPG